ncbi:2-oxoglutarate ferredoxin oxidoreductase subunit alpha [Legionella sainthelensi]|nr:2-oxoglutarate ferredoxin oxidoreductase subunit alpha [Legionella sainthelensi]
MSTTDMIAIRITRDSGDGVRLVGKQLILSAALPENGNFGAKFKEKSS